jgi:hypothetical protein
VNNYAKRAVLHLAVPPEGTLFSPGDGSLRIRGARGTTWRGNTP